MSRRLAPVVGGEAGERRTPAGGDARSICLSARGVSVRAAGTRILQPTTIFVQAGELVGVIGPSGAGKSTLLRVLAGVRAPDEGSVLLGDHWVQSRSTEIGYVPFGTPIHAQLTVREALLYAARLRLPHAGPDDVRDHVEAVLRDLHLEDSAEVRVGLLSDGQKRRAACGAELVGRPAMLLLDEPTTGLDVTLERRMMRTLRRLADEGRGVLVTTHTTASLDLCDRVAVMAPGGVLLFAGPPGAVRAHFGVSEIADVFEAFDAAVDLVPVATAGSDDSHEGSRAALPELPPFGTQARAMAGRYARCQIRERRALLLLLGQAPVIGVTIGVVLPENAVADTTLGPYYKMLLSFLLLTAALWLGLISSCREIVREREIIEREFSVGVRIDAYLAAKCAVLLPLAAAQVVLLVLSALVVQPLQDGGGATVLQVVVICTCCAWAAVGIGMLVSAAVLQSDHATGSIPLLLIPQLLLAGALIPFHTLSGPIKLIGDVMISRWALVGLGSALGLDQVTGNGIGTLVGSDASFYQPGIPTAALLLITLLIATLVASGLTLARRITR